MSDCNTHEWEQVWLCPRCGKTEAKSSTGHEKDGHGWAFTVHLAPDATEVELRHEVAHILQRFRHGPTVDVHGQEFEDSLRRIL